MLKQFIKGRTAVFIDAANILYSQQNLGWRVDYTKLKEYFERESDVYGIYFYTGRMLSHERQSKFIQKLISIGYTVTEKEVKRILVGRNTYEWKGNLDIELAIGVLKNIQNFDTLILMSGDSDFAPLLDAVKQAGKRVIVMSTKGHVAHELLARAKYINLKKLEAELRYYKTKSPPRSGGEV